jgi:predicted nucleic acid-binding protein
MIVLVDTNILLDVIMQREPFRVVAERVWKLVEEGQLDGHIAAISLNNIFYLARKTLGSAGALDAVRDVRRLFKLVPLDERVVDAALDSAGADLEDAIQAASALHVLARHVVTRNVSDFASLGISAVSGEQLLGLLPPAAKP